MAQHVINPVFGAEGKRDDAAADGAFGRGQRVSFVNRPACDHHLTSQAYDPVDGHRVDRNGRCRTADGWCEHVRNFQTGAPALLCYAEQETIGPLSGDCNRVDIRNFRTQTVGRQMLPKVDYG